MSIVTLSKDDAGAWCPVEDPPNTQDTYRLCENYVTHNVCNWALPGDSPEALCRSCSLTHTIPLLDSLENRAAWYRLETAKRRMLYTLLSLELPVVSKIAEPVTGLEFQFMSDIVKPSGDRSRVLTGHDDGLITINIAEADDLYRESQRLHQHEPYRTLLGHFRHEIGHYYWDRFDREQRTDWRSFELCLATNRSTTRRRCNATMTRVRH